MDTANWRTGLATVDRIREDIVARNDETAARALIALAGKFARSEVNTSVSLSERYFVAHLNGEAVPFHDKAYDAIDDFANSVDFPVDFLREIVVDPWSRWEVLTSVYGLGPTKAAMTVALLGGRLGCIDRHMLAAALHTTVDAEGFTALYKQHAGSPKRYRTAHETVFAGVEDPREMQWQMFWDLDDRNTKGTPGADFRRSSHMPYFMAVCSLV